MVSAAMQNLGQFDVPLSVAEIEELNLELLSNADRWQFSSPGRGSMLPVLPPPAAASVLERGIEIADDPNAELLHSFSPNRWLYAGHIPWPVERWWRGWPEQAQPFPAAFKRGGVAYVQQA